MFQETSFLVISFITTSEMANSSSVDSVAVFPNSLMDPHHMSFHIVFSRKSNTTNIACKWGFFPK